MPHFKLPKLPYTYDALEPYIDAKTMEIHHTKHHQNYVDKLNKALVTEKSPSNLEDILKHISRYSIATRSNGGGHYNHSFFWSILSPNKGKNPSGALEKAIKKEFNNIATLKEKFSLIATTHFGSGWAWLYVDAQRHLQISTTPNQDNPLMDISIQQGTPILTIDLWEHAYYLKYQNKRSAYIEAFWKVVDWEAVGKHYDKALLLNPKNA